jgi:replicative DNA helicase
MRRDFLPDQPKTVNSNVAPPHDLEAEQGLLGDLLINGRSFEAVSEFDSRQFFDPVHQVIFDAIAEFARDGRSITPITIGSRLADLPAVGEVSARQYIARLAGAAAGPSQVPELAKLIADLARRRQILLLAEDMLGGCSDFTRPLPAQIQDYETRLYNLTGESANSREFSSQKMMDWALKDVTDAMMRGDGMSGLSTGFRDLDAMIGGLSNSNLIVLAGRPAMGKSACATNIAYNVAKTGIPVGFFSQEMSAVQLAMRVMGEHSGIASHRLRTGKVDPDKVRELREVVATLGKLPITVDETGGLSLAALTAKARRWKRQKQIGLLVIDYIQLMRGSSRSGNRVEDVTEITTGLKALAKELAVPVIALSQLSRALESRENKRPQLSDLRESGSIEQDADEVLFVFREEYYVARDEPSITDYAAYQDWTAKKQQVAGLAEIIAGKSRHGPTGIVKLYFDAHLTRFSDLAHGDRR